VRSVKIEICFAVRQAFHPKTIHLAREFVAKFLEQGCVHYVTSDRIQHVLDTPPLLQVPCSSPASR
jgi:hypothetical protein